MLGNVSEYVTDIARIVRFDVAKQHFTIFWGGRVNPIKWYGNPRKQRDICQSCQPIGSRMCVIQPSQRTYPADRSNYTARVCDNLVTQYKYSLGKHKIFWVVRVQGLSKRDAPLFAQASKQGQHCDPGGAPFGRGFFRYEYDKAIRRVGLDSVESIPVMIQHWRIIIMV